MRIDNYIGYIYVLVEHQSKPEKYMALRIIRYTLKIMEEHIRNKKTVPLVYPMVVYNGDQPYNYHTDIRNLVDAPKNLVKKYLFKAFKLINLNKITDEEFEASLWGGMLQWILKHAREKDFLLRLQQKMPRLKQILDQDGKHYVIILLNYCLVFSDLENDEEFIRLARDGLSDEMGDEIMTLGERLIRQGLEQGRNMEKEHIAKTMLKEGIKVDLISKFTGLPRNDIERLMTEKQ